MNNRGRRRHIQAIQLFELEPIPSAPVELKKGRDQELLAARNKKIVLRYYYYAKLKKIQYDEILKSLKTEFDISNKTISNVLFVDNYNEVSNVMQSKPTIKQLKKELPYFAWS